MVLDVQRLRRPDDVATVERRYLQLVQRPRHQSTQPVQPVVFNQDPQQVLGFAVPAVLQTLFGEVRVDLRQILRVAHPVIRLGHHPLAGAADGEYGQTHLLGLGEIAGIQRVAEKLVLLLDDSGARTRPAGYLFQFDAHAVAHHARCRVEFGCATLRNAAREKGVLHWFLLNSGADGPCQIWLPCPGINFNV